MMKPNHKTPGPNNRKAPNPHSARPLMRQGVTQLKSAVPLIPRQPPAAPPAYRPQPTPRVLQTKRASVQHLHTAKTHQPAVPSARNVVSPKIASHSTPKAPAVYRPQPVPKVLQAKMVSSRPV